MGAYLLALVGVLEELRVIEAGELEVRAKPLGRVLDAEALAVLVDEKRRRGSWVVAQREPSVGRWSDAGRQRPRAGVIRLVRLQA
ncbi:hypothetical protein WME90_31850 [Sorangium sp. So ce375]|uniref:hypothetical protein n=1 Tax=Sorangium sp. So ce375 TaxID=3133306 RepID=UPI003F5C5F97